MFGIRIVEAWERVAREATPESAYVSRGAGSRADATGPGRDREIPRRDLLGLAIAGAGAAILGPACRNGSTAGDSSRARGGAGIDATRDAARGEGSGDASRAADASAPHAIPPGAPARDLYPARRDDRFSLDRALTDEVVAATYNNYYEFTEAKDGVWMECRDLRVSPWSLEITGLCENPETLDVDAWIRAHREHLQERLYRHRCVEAWAMAVPWTGIPLREVVARARPSTRAKYVRFVSFLRPDEAPGQKAASWYPWPYYEGLTLAEATNDLALLGTGIYGHPLPIPNGAPLRLVLPWKYGFKSIKGIVRIEFVETRPRTFWSDLVPSEYDFLANVNPAAPHPRWSQARERMIGTNEMRPTLPYNGYGEWVAGLYTG